MLWRIVILSILGIVAGLLIAVLQLRQDVSALEIENGPWNTAQGMGSADGSRFTRALVALRGIMALPDSEAIYYNASVDSDGNMLDGACTYEVRGGKIEARWWTLTLYNVEGYLIASEGDRYSYGSNNIAQEKQGDWQITVGPSADSDIATDPAASFQLTMRAYHPSQAFLENRAVTELPGIYRVECPK